MLNSYRRVNILKSCELEVSVPLSEVTSPELLPRTETCTPASLYNI